MKRYNTLIAVLALCVALTGCKESGSHSPNAPSSNAESDCVSSDLSESSSVSTPESSLSNTESEPQLTRAECEQIVTIFKAWGDLNYNIHTDRTDTSRPGYIPPCIDASKYITDEMPCNKGSILTYTEYFYLVKSGDFSTEKGFNEKLDGMFTEKFKKQYMGSSSWQMFRFKDGETYTMGFKHYDETEPEISVRLNIESVDEKKVALSVVDTSDSSYIQSYKITLLRLENDSFKIDEIDENDSGFFMIPERFHYKNVKVTVYWQDDALFTL